jgi:hypothetical protein
MEEKNRQFVPVLLPMLAAVLGVVDWDTGTGALVG